ncbi:hypothetical protein F966_01400 [Acinetobacter higginsii]|uniref:ABC-three component systems C-terminal domain-containing protein n=1 Tax=Acinetobacter higginsii TaxID=70347 RepID=N8WDN7_9GAMM|nr:ABC-three component system protein [Acinetobacter higginsii]ENV10227.1 hypothetical protein F966_01400 [Acinetobacter higginsii]
MNDKIITPLEKLQENMNAGGGIAGYDYQFYYFLYCLLELKTGEEVGFEAKEDVHVTSKNGQTILSQVKHTISENNKGEKINLTDSDDDLWKTLYNWVEFINAQKLDEKENFVLNHRFILITNKTIGENSLASKFGDFLLETKAIEEIRKLCGKTKSPETKKYMSNFLALDAKILSLFFKRIEVVSEKEPIIEKLKNKVKERMNGSVFYLEAYRKLSSSVFDDKYLDLTIKKSFTVSHDDFFEKYNNCFNRAYMEGTLAMPDRELEIIYPFDLENQKFIKQLVDIDFIEVNNTRKIKDMTTIMLNFLNCINYWKENHLIVSSDVEDLYDESVYVWENEFEEKFDEIKILLREIDDVRDDEINKKINKSARELVNSVRKLKVKIQNREEFSPKLSNGCFYYLSDLLRIGWHYDWEDKYR